MYNELYELYLFIHINNQIIEKTLLKKHYICICIVIKI
jgi:hypothetical protein